VKAVRIHRYGGAEVVRYEEVARPRPGAGELLVEVHAAGVNPVDYKIRDGALRRLRRDRLPLTLGCELSGVVVERGAGVADIGEGDAVFARVEKQRLGAFAEYALVRRIDLAAKPPELTHTEAASLPLAALTAWQALVDHARLASGQTLLVHAAAGGVGVMATQLGRHLGATVVATASAANRELCESLGAAQVIDYRTRRFEDEVGSCDVVLDTLGGDVLRRSLDVTARGGNVVSIAGRPTAAFARAAGLPTVAVWALALAGWPTARHARRRGVTHTYFMMQPSGAQLGELAALASRRVLRPVVDRVLPLAEAAAALDHLAGGHARGKVVLLVRP
jgi:NADPH:quinone reductase-like Zn-dependent oxidoreductase